MMCRLMYLLANVKEKKDYVIPAFLVNFFIIYFKSQHIVPLKYIRVKNKVATSFFISWQTREKKQSVKAFSS